MTEYKNGPSVPHLQGKTVQHNIQHVEPVMVPSVPKEVLDKYKKVTLCCDLMNINGIVFLNTIPLQIMFSTGSMIEDHKIKNIAYGIKQVHYIYL